MPETSPPPNRGQQRLEERVYRLEERVHQLANALDMQTYKLAELDKDFQEYRKQTTERMKWGWMAFIAFMGSIVVPLALFFANISTKGPPGP